MSVYDERYEVYYKQRSYYTSDPAKALQCLDQDPENGWCNEGYGYWRDVLPYDGVSEVTRRTLGPVSRQHLLALVADREYTAYRSRVQATIEQLRS